MRRAVSVALGALRLTGCSAVRAATGGDDEPGPLVVVLFDVSRSTDDPEVRARYLTTFETVLDHVVPTHGTVVGDVIDDDPLAHSTFPISATFEGCTRSPRTSSCAMRHSRADAERPRSRPRATILARNTGAAGTDIHDGLLLAQRVFDAYPEAGPRSLVLLSDMVERSARLNVAGVGADDASIASTIDGLAAEGLIAGPARRAGLRGGGGRVAGRHGHAGRPVPRRSSASGRRTCRGPARICRRSGTARRSCGSPRTRRSMTSPEPPFSIEPVLGWRVWRLVRVRGRLALRSLTHDSVWMPDESMHATCGRLSSGHRSPAEGCTCGLYATSTPEALARARVFNPGTGVVGAIAMWGRVVEHGRGARSEFAYPARLRLVCGSCLAQGSGAVAPVEVVESGGGLVPFCRKHLGRPARTDGQRVGHRGRAALDVRRGAPPDRTRRSSRCGSRAARCRGR